MAWKLSCAWVLMSNALFCRGRCCGTVRTASSDTATRRWSFRRLRRDVVKKFSGLDDFVAAQGSQLGPTDWLEVTQDRVNLFADATDDHQWIHVDPEKAANGPFGGTIAHGLLTLSLLPHFSHQLYRVDNIAMAINYGYNKVRFITPVKVGAKVRARGELTSVNQLNGAVQATTTITVEIDGSDKPAAVAESIVRYIG